MLPKTLSHLPLPSPAPALTCHFRREMKSLRWSVLMTFPLASVCGVREQRCLLEPAAGSGNPVASWHWVRAQAHLEPGMLQGLFCIGSPVNQHHWVRTTQAQGLWPGQESLADHGAPQQSIAASLALGHPNAWESPHSLEHKAHAEGAGDGEGVPAVLTACH